MHPIDAAIAKLRRKPGNEHLKPVVWLASAQKDLSELPDDVQDAIGHALHVAQSGSTVDYAAPLHGFGGGVWEIKDDFNTNTYRGVYVVRFEGVVFVLHCFQKKSKRGIAMPREDEERIEGRLQDARALYESWKAKQEQEKK